MYWDNKWTKPSPLWDTEAVENQSVVHELDQNDRLHVSFFAAKLEFKEQTKGHWPQYCLMHPDIFDGFVATHEYVPAWEKSKGKYMEVQIVPTPSVPYGCLVMRSTTRFKR